MFLYWVQQHLHSLLCVLYGKEAWLGSQADLHCPASFAPTPHDCKIQTQCSEFLFAKYEEGASPGRLCEKVERVDDT